ncbi:hypothetical protein ALT1644_610005 [Alteromonas macleodii]
MSVLTIRKYQDWRTGIIYYQDGIYYYDSRVASTRCIATSLGSSIRCTIPKNSMVTAVN